MLKKLRRFIIKKTLEKKLLEELKTLNILEEQENAELIVDDETDFYVSFDLKTSKDLFKKVKKVYFSDTGKDKMSVEVILGNTYKNHETIVFSVTNFLDLHPKMYTIALISKNGYNILQKIDFNSGKITCSMCIAETYGDQLGLAVVLNGEMADIALKLFKREITELTIRVNDFGEKIYWFGLTFSKIVYKPETSINLKQFDSLKKYF